MNEISLRYCPKCAGTVIKKGPALLVCRGCGFCNYINPRPCNAVILHDKAKTQVLLVQRKYDPHKGMWDLPGGFLNLNETVEQSVHREIKEELGIKLTNPLVYLGTFSDRYRYQGIHYHTVGIIYTSSLEKDSDPICNDDAEILRWFPTSHIPYDTLAFTSIKKALRRFCRRRTTQ